MRERPHETVRSRTMRRTRLADLEVVLGGGPDGQGGGTGPMLVLLHAYGTLGDELVPFARQLDVPDAVRFAFPAAPLALERGAPLEIVGRAWWHIDMIELQRAVMFDDYEDLIRRVPAGLTEARQQVGALLDTLEQEHAVTPDKLVLGGFSQGAMLATDVLLHSVRGAAALVLLSSSLITKDIWLPLMKARAGLSVLQSHGRQDPLLSFEGAEKLRDALLAAGLKVEFHAFDGGHSIPNSAALALAKLLTSVAG
jgi:phospholipase/carboxylesterase